MTFVSSVGSDCIEVVAVLLIQKRGVYIMACAPEDTPSPELLALQKNSAKLCDGIPNISTVTHFAQSLEERAFITSHARLHTVGISDYDKCAHLLQAVQAQVRNDPAKFESFVTILRQEPALTCYTDILINSRGEKCVYTSMDEKYRNKEAEMQRMMACNPMKYKMGFTHVIVECHHPLP